MSYELWCCTHGYSISLSGRTNFSTLPQPLNSLNTLNIFNILNSLNLANHAQRTAP